MFKTSAECQLELVAHSIKATPPFYVDLDELSGEFYPVIQTTLDDFPCSAARVSFGREDKTGDDPEKDIKLMNYLADNKHMSPFEHQSATFLVECPLFVRSQIHRHRTFSYNEISRRYTDENIEFWQPDSWRVQAKSNRQASDGAVDKTASDYANIMMQEQCRIAKSQYEALLALGVAREQARSILPQSLLTKFYMTGNLRNWAHFLDLRLDPHAQEEVRIVAQRIEEKLYALWPSALKALMEDRSPAE